MKKQHIKWFLFFSLLIFLAGCKSNQTVTKRTEKSNTQNWVGTWATAQQLVEPKNMPPAPGLTDNTIRQIIRVSIGGKRMRLRFSNVFSDEATVLKSVSVANVVEGASIDGKTQKILSFNGNAGITMNPQQEVFSDAFDFALKAGNF